MQSKNHSSIVGIWPIDSMKLVKLIEFEQPQGKFREDDLNIACAISLASDHLSTLDSLSSKKDTQKRKHTAALSTEFAVVLTDPTPIATLIHEADLSKVRSMKAAELHAHLRQKIGISEAEMTKDGKWKNKKELQAIVKARYDAALANTSSLIENTIASKRIRCPPPMLDQIGTSSTPLIAAVISVSGSRRDECPSRMSRWT